MTKAYYAFTAIFEADPDDGNLVNFEFPDLENCFGNAPTLEEPVVEAKEILQNVLVWMERDGQMIPEPSDLASIKMGERQVWSLVVADLKSARRAWDNSPGVGKAEQKGAKMTKTSGESDRRKEEELKTTTIQVPVKLALKEEAEKIFDTAGLFTAEVVQHFLERIVAEGRIPSWLEIPNEETRKVIEHMRSGRNGVRCKDVEDLWRKLDEEA